jgi:hypothetical protein
MLDTWTCLLIVVINFTLGTGEFRRKYHRDQQRYVLKIKIQKIMSVVARYSNKLKSHETFAVECTTGTQTNSNTGTQTNSKK